ncbi:hypothetical protein [Nostoc sp.]|uniref:hypothetical protein n=1 Tax=Nostoc sp. TaxID=1180 RepID=UPI002FF87E0F
MICNRISRVYFDLLEETIKNLLHSLGKLNASYLTAVEEKLLSVLESEYGGEILPQATLANWHPMSLDCSFNGVSNTTGK